MKIESSSKSQLFTAPSRAATAITLFLVSLWYVYVLLAPTSGFYWVDSWHNEQRAVQIVLLITTAVAMTALAVDRSWLQVVPPPPSTLVVLVGIGCVSALLSARQLDAFAEVALHVLLALVVMLIAAAARQVGAAAAKMACRAVLFVGAAHVVGVAVRYGAAISLDKPLDLELLLLGYANPRFPSALYALLFPFLAATQLDRAERMDLRACAALVAALLWAINIGLGTRAIWLAYALAAPILVFAVGWRPVWPALRTVGATMAAGIGMNLLLFKGIPEWLGTGEVIPSRLDNLTTLSARELLYSSAWEAVRSAPLLGIGPMQFAAIPGVWAAHPHSWALQLAAEWGLPALAMGVLAVVAFLRRVASAIRTSADSAGLMLPALGATLVALLVGLVDGNLVMPVSQTATAMAFGLLIGSLPPPQARDGAALSKLTLALGITASAILGSYCARTLPVQESVEARYRQQYPARPLWPRFWQQGFLQEEKRVVSDPLRPTGGE